MGVLDVLARAFRDGTNALRLAVAHNGWRAHCLNCGHHKVFILPENCMLFVRLLLYLINVALDFDGCHVASVWWVLFFFNSSAAPQNLLPVRAVVINRPPAIYFYFYTKNRGVPHG